ncbi:hypothetical protein GDO81_004546 [Engystomops pustulosus]|uniref:Uncharacterized protein n=1 Tax=Engystomops pustulosus TaxID=76066 RepID=A0AAV6ZT29_ENGPU|nr:hypothetical protein GDO81_004546 [Engystomops pustulosus]
MSINPIRHELHYIPEVNWNKTFEPCSPNSCFQALNGIDEYRTGTSCRLLTSLGSFPRWMIRSFLSLSLPCTGK